MRPRPATRCLAPFVRKPIKAYAYTRPKGYLIPSLCGGQEKQLANGVSRPWSLDRAGQATWAYADERLQPLQIKVAFASARNDDALLLCSAAMCSRASALRGGNRPKPG